MSPLLFALVDAMQVEEVRLVREQRAWDRAHYGSRCREAYNEDLRYVRSWLGWWRSLWGVL